MSKTLKMIVKELPRTMGELNHQLLYDDLKQALKEVKELEQQLQQAHRAGWEQAKREVANTCHNHRSDYGIGGEYIVDSVGRAIANLEYKEQTNDR